MPLPKPKKGQSQSDFMKQCMSEAYGSDAPKDRTQEQAVAMCMDAWRQAHGGKKPKSNDAEVKRIIALWQKLLARQGDVPVPEPDESKDDFMMRCIDELGDLDEADAEDACELSWESYQEESGERAGIVHKQHATSADGMEFILSDATPDRFGDIVDPKGWEFKNFLRNPIALFNHSSDFPIGTWKQLRIEDDALRGNLVIAPKGTSPRIDEIRSLIEAGILRAVSVGFKPIEQKPRGENMRGMVYVRSELVETSLVSIPANPNALAVAKSLNISPETQRLVFGEHADKNASRASSSARNRGEHADKRRRAITAGEHAANRMMRGHPMSTSLSKRIEDAQHYLVQLNDQLSEHLKNVDEEAPDEAAMTVTEELTGKIEAQKRYLAGLKSAEKQLAFTVDHNDDGTNGGGDEHKQRGNGKLITSTARPFTMPRKNLEPIDIFWRTCTVIALSRVTQKPFEAIVAERYPDDQLTRGMLPIVSRAATAPATTTTAGWAAELVQTAVADLVQRLMPMSIYPGLSAQGARFTFGRNGIISVPARANTPTVAGSFVGQGNPIPVRQAAFTAITLTPKKMAVISSMTREIQEHSTPAIEGIIRQAILEDTAVSLDTVLIDNAAATTIRPAGLLNGVSTAPGTPTAGGGFNALVADLKALIGVLVGQNALRNPVWIMNPAQAVSIALTQNAGGDFPFRAEINAGTLLTYPVLKSTTVPAGTVILLDAADFVTVTGDDPRFDVSDQATLHFEDTNPAQISTVGTPNVVAAPVRSLWQTDSIAIRMILDCNWAMRRTGLVTYAAAVTW